MNMKLAAALMGRKGGSRNTPKQLAVKAANGRLGGRPRCYRVVNGVLERRVSARTWKEVKEPMNAAAKAFLRRHRSTAAERDRLSADEERSYVATLPRDVPLCSMCVAKAVATTGDVCDNCYNAYHQTPRVSSIIPDPE